MAPYHLTRKRFALTALLLVDTMAYYPECAQLLRYMKTMLNNNHVYYWGPGGNADDGLAFNSSNDGSLGPDFAAYLFFDDLVA